MIVVGLDSGMGNQMFQYALGYALAEERREDFYIDLSYFKWNARPYALSSFKISAPKFLLPSLPFDNKIVRVFWRALKLKKMGIFNSVIIKEKTEHQWKYIPEYFNTKKSIYLNGFWQNYRYFDNYKSSIKKEFTLIDDRITQEMQQILENVTSVDSVSIHIRKGDYVKCNGWLLDDEYYKKAISKFDKNKVVFYVFCEDKECIRDIMRDTKYVVVNEDRKLDDIQEFWVMKSCKHHVICNSTYSWWAAYLSNEGKVIAPVFKWWNDEIYPKEWTKIRL